MRSTETAAAARLAHAGLGAISRIALHRPFSVSFRSEDAEYLYLIDIGGLRRSGDDVIHETPHGSFSFSGKSIEDVRAASTTLGARLTLEARV